MESCENRVNSPSDNWNVRAVNWFLNMNEPSTNSASVTQCAMCIISMAVFKRLWLFIFFRLSFIHDSNGISLPKCENQSKNLNIWSFRQSGSVEVFGLRWSLSAHSVDHYTTMIIMRRGPAAQRLADGVDFMLNCKALKSLRFHNGKTIEVCKSPSRWCFMPSQMGSSHVVGKIGKKAKVTHLAHWPPVMGFRLELHQEISKCV